MKIKKAFHKEKKKKKKKKKKTFVFMLQFCL